MKSAFNLFEKVLFLLLIISSSVVLIIQFLNYSNDDLISSSMFNEYRISSSYNGESINKGVITLKNMTPNYKEVDVLVNGEYVCDFTNDNEINIYVYHNDIIEVDGTKYNNKVQIKVMGISKNVDSPKLDTITTTLQSIEILGKVQLK